MASICFFCGLQVSVANVGVVDHSDPGTGNVLHAKIVIVTSIKTRPSTLNKTVLHQKYVLEKRSLRQIAREFASSKTGVRQALVRFRIPLREKGQSPNRTHNLPFGKKVIKGKVVDHEGERRVIESVLKMHGEGLSNCAIARVLSEMKVPTKQQGRRWHHEMVRQILLRSKCGKRKEFVSESDILKKYRKENPVPSLSQ